MVASGCFRLFSDVYSDMKSHVDIHKRDLYSCYLESQSKNDHFWMKIDLFGLVKQGASS